MLEKIFASTRQRTVEICAPLRTEDLVVQTAPEVSPPKWHLGHTTWFFDRFLVRQFGRGKGRKQEPERSHYDFVFNSYYDSVGPFWPRERRGQLSRPTVNEILEYRRQTDEAVIELLSTCSQEGRDQVAAILTIGIHHEQQHQELLMMDIKHILWSNPDRPAYRPARDRGSDPFPEVPEIETFSEGLYPIGALEDGRFSYDNERPVHQVHLNPYALEVVPVTNGRFIEFIEDGGYSRSELWLSDGFEQVRRNEWNAPLYWERSGQRWFHFTFDGMEPVNPLDPVCHVSYFEADAFARWSRVRLPSEAEWEVGAGRLRHGSVWEWTASGYLPYPGFRPTDGFLSEYNGKFMCNQMVLRGASLHTPKGHSRPTYRNYFAPWTRWAFSGFRLGRDVR